MNGHLDNQTSGNEWGSVINAVTLNSVFGSLRTNPLGLNQSIFEVNEEVMDQLEARHKECLDQVRKHYVMRTDSCVTAFLNSHRAIPQLLLSAVPHLKASFGANTIFTLEAPTDEQGWQTLYAVAMWPGKARDAVAALDQFDAAWWIRNSRQASGNLTFTYELV